MEKTNTVRARVRVRSFVRDRKRRFMRTENRLEVEKGKEPHSRREKLVFRFMF
jgi:hypothetical protein